MRKSALCLLAALWTSSLFGAQLKIEIRNVMDLATYEPIKTFLIPIDPNGETSFNESVYSWGTFFESTGYHFHVSGVVRKMPGKETYYVDFKKDLYKEEDSSTHPLTGGEYLLFAGRKSVLSNDYYWAAGLKLVLRQENILSIIPD